MKRYILTMVASMSLLFAPSAQAQKTIDEIAQMCQTLSNTIVSLAERQTKAVCQSRLYHGANLVEDAGHFILLNEKVYARLNINSAIEEIGMSELSGCKELTKLHFAKADAYEIRNEIDALTPPEVH